MKQTILKRHPELVQQLGTAPDSEIAKRFRCSMGTVQNARVRLGIAPFGRRTTGAAQMTAALTYAQQRKLAALAADAQCSISEMVGRLIDNAATP
jgi:hypothetical protein